jgi:hypothetical protein
MSQMEEDSSRTHAIANWLKHPYNSDSWLWVDYIYFRIFGA